MSAGSLSAASSPVYTAEAYRSWMYLDYTCMFSDNWGVSVLGSHSYEYERDNNLPSSHPKYSTNTFAKQTFLYEIFAGPMYVQKFGDLTFKLPVWYYYQGFPTRNHEAKDTYYHTHNIEIVPTVDYKMGKWTFWNRIILHNKVYSSIYGSEAKYAGLDDSKYSNGYSLLIREYFRVQYAINDKLRVLIGNEIFVGVVEDKDTTDLHLANQPRIGPQFERKGFDQNRTYMGFSYTLAPGLAITPLYMYQMVYNVPGERKLTERDHYLFMVLSYQMKTY
jgi:hypothetical protein